MNSTKKIESFKSQEIKNPIKVNGGGNGYWVYVGGVGYWIKAN